MPCKRYEEDVVETALGTPPTSAFATHLETCEPCRGRLDDERTFLSTVDGVLRETLDVEPGAGFARGVRARTEARRATARARGWRWAAVTAAAVMALMAAMRPPRLEPRQAAGPAASPSPTHWAPVARDRIPEGGGTPPVPAPRVARPARPSEPLVLVSPDAGAALRRYREALASQELRITGMVAANDAERTLKEPQLQLPALDVGALEDLPRLKVVGAMAEGRLPSTQDDPSKGGGV